MTHISPLCDPAPVAATFFECFPHFDIESGGIHAPIIAKFCASGKQHFAEPPSKDCGVDQKPLNQVLSVVLKRAMDARGLNDTALAKQAGVAANTVANYSAWSPDDFTPKGKQKSAKLVEVEMIAAALEIHPLMLLIDMQDTAAVLDLVARLTAHLASPQAPPQAPGNVPGPTPRRANGV